MKYPRDQPQLTIRSNDIAGKIRNGNNELTDFINDDSYNYVYVQQEFSPVLDQQAVIEGHMCRVWHPNQALKFVKRVFLVLRVGGVFSTRAPNHRV